MEASETKTKKVKTAAIASSSCSSTDFGKVRGDGGVGHGGNGDQPPGTAYAFAVNSTLSDDHDTSPDLHASGQLHPLKNPVILIHLFERCPTNLLTNLRLVCRQWHDLSLSLWRSSSQIRLHSDSNYWGKIFCNDESTLSEFMDYVEDPESNCETKPFRNMKLDSWEFHAEHLEMQSFWDLFGTHLTSLELKECSFTSVEEFRRIIYKYFPKLRSLTFCGCDWYHFNYFLPSPSSSSLASEEEEDPLGALEYRDPVYGRHDNLKSLTVFSDEETLLPTPISWLELLSHFQSLTSLSVSLPRCVQRMQMEVNEILRAIRIIRERNGRDKIPLEEFATDPALKVSLEPATHGTFVVLEELQIPLQGLRVEAHRELDTPLVQNLVEFHRDSLRRIRAYVDEDAAVSLSCLDFCWNFPCQMELSKLEELDIHNLDLISLGFLEYTPNLRRLTIRPFKKEPPKTQMVTGTERLPEVELLHLTHLHFGYMLSEGELARLVKWLPNVDELTMPLNDKLLGIVCDHWRKLKGLTVLPVHGSDLTKEVMPEYIPPDVTHLQDLERIRIGSPNLGNASLFHGLLLLPKLRTVEACRKIFQDSVGEWGKRTMDDMRKKNIIIKLVHSRSFFNIVNI